VTKAITTRKLVAKTHIGAKAIKKYDTVQTPHQRAMASPDITKKIEIALTRQYRQLNPPSCVATSHPQ